MDWNALAKAAQEAFREGVNDWIGRARIQGGQVNGPRCSLTPGSLISEGNIEVKMMDSLLRSKTHPEIARSLAKELAGAWYEWAKGFQMEVPAAYPSFAAFPGPFAPETPMTPAAVPLSKAVSPGEVGLKAAFLASRLSGALRMHAMKLGGASPDAAMKGLAQWIEESFTEWKSRTSLVGVMGKGPVPTFAPPYVPVGPVIKGSNVGGTGPVMAGPQFGKVTI